MNSIWKTVVIAAIMVISQFLLLCSPQQALAACPPVGYTSVGGVCIKTVPTATSQQTFRDLLYGKFFFTEDENHNALLYETMKGGANIFEFGTSITNVLANISEQPDPTNPTNLLTYWQITDAAGQHPSWLDGLASVNSVQESFTDPNMGLITLTYNIYTGSLFDFLVNHSSPDSSQPVDQIGDYGVGFFGKQTTLYSHDETNSNRDFTALIKTLTLEQHRGLLDIDLEFFATNYVFREPAAAVPEPSTLLLLGAGFAGLAGAGFRRRLKNRGL